MSKPQCEHRDCVRASGSEIVKCMDCQLTGRLNHLTGETDWDTVAPQLPAQGIADASVKDAKECLSEAQMLNRNSVRGQWPNSAVIRLAEAVINMGQRLAAVTSERDALASERDSLRAAAVKLVTKMEAITSSPDWNAIHSTAFVHGVKYRGDNWESEFVALKSLLSPSASEAAGEGRVQA